MEISAKGRKSPKRILIDISEKEHESIKTICKTKNITIRKWILSLIYRELNND